MTRLVPLTDDVWTVRAPLRFLSFAIGTRMTVVKLPDGGLLLHSPVSLDDALKQELDALGRVRHIVCPDVYHHLFAGPLLAAYPDAALHAPAALRRKRKDLAITHDLGAPHPDWQSVLSTVHIDGSMLDETVLFHSPTGTIISADLLEYFERCDEAWTRAYLKAAGVYQRATWNRLLRMLYRDRRAARRSIDRILEWPAERIVIAHGDVIKDNARDALRDGFAWL